MSSAPNKIIYSMVGVGKYYDKKPVIKDIYLSYFYGAKIGVIGLNGSGKSSLLRIIAGVDKEFVGETVTAFAMLCDFSLTIHIRCVNPTSHCSVRRQS